MSWARLFDRADSLDAAIDDIEEARQTDRPAGEWDRERRSEKGDDALRVVADADVLAADVLVGGDSRAALDHVRQHSWLRLVASDELLAEAGHVLGELADPGLAEDWHERIDRERLRVEHPPGDHPALASAYRGEARHLLTWDGELTAPGTSRGLQGHMAVSIREPTAFARLFDAQSVYEGLFEESYPGPDRDPRA